MQLNMNNNAVALAAIALAGTICTGFFALVSKQIKTHERIALALDKNTESNKQIAKETRQGNAEAKERNGHLAELVIETTKGIHDSLEKPVNVQTVETQVIKEQR